jgi:catechol 2,3-dioxygenase-like lactoylglutathione lyase family enzyme
MATNIGNRVLPCFLVADMRRSLDFYVETLGFTQTGYYPIESEPIRTEVRRDEVAIVLFTEAVRVHDREPTFTGGLYLFPHDLQGVAAELNGRVPFIWGLEESEYGYREFAIRDPDGYTLVFAEPVLSSK